MNSKIREDKLFFKENYRGHILLKVIHKEFYISWSRQNSLCGFSRRKFYWTSWRKTFTEVHPDNNFNGGHKKPLDYENWASRQVQNWEIFSELLRLEKRQSGSTNLRFSWGIGYGSNLQKYLSNKIVKFKMQNGKSGLWEVRFMVRKDRKQLIASERSNCSKQNPGNKEEKAENRTRTDSQI